MVALVQYARTLLKDKVLFGTDWPLLTIDRWEEEFNAYGLPAELSRKIMLENAMKLLDLEQ